jgi:hypothetical protein
MAAPMARRAWKLGRPHRFAWPGRIDRVRPPTMDFGE